MSSSAPREPLVPTINFSMVCPGVYRSGYPTKKNFSFLRALRLRSILYLCPEDYAESNLKFCEENGIHVLRFPTEGNKEPFHDISEPLMHRILGAVCDTRNLPLLIHCNKGKHRTGTVVACLRQLQGWSLVSIFEEYKRFASDKARVGDQQYVELYRPIVKLTSPFIAPWVTITPRITLVTSERELMEAEATQLGTSLLAPDKMHAKVGGGPLKTVMPAATASVPMSATPTLHSNAPSPVSGVPPPLSLNGQSSSPATTTTPTVSLPAGVSASIANPHTPPLATSPAFLSSGGKQQQITPIPAHATTTSNSYSNNTAAVSSVVGEGVGTTSASVMNSSSADPTDKGLLSHTPWSSLTSAPPPAGVTTVPPTPSISHVSSGGANPHSSTPSPDNEKQP